MPPVGVPLEHDDRVRSRPDVGSAPVAADGLHRRPTRTLAVDLERLAVDAEPVQEETDVPAMDTAELEEASSARRSDSRRPRSIDPRYVQRARARGRTVSPQPSPNPIAVEVAERYAKALTLSPNAPTLPEPRAPRRSRAAMRDRALDSPARSSGRRRAPTPAPAAPSDSPRLVRATGETVAPVPAAASGRPRLARATAETAAPAPAPRSARRAAPAAPVAGLRIPDDGDSDAAVATGRRTVTIRGRGAERDYGWATYDSSRRPNVPAHERAGFKPDRAALWAVFLGLLLVLVAATSAHAAVLAHAVR
jgi:hypothetical protein